jgi:peptide chain release factor 3
MENMDFSVARWVKNKKAEELKKYVNSRCSLVFDHFERPILLFANTYTLGNFMEKNEDVELVEALAVDDNF